MSEGFLSRYLPQASVLFRALPRVLRRHKLITAWMRLTGEDPIQLVPIRDKAEGFVDLREGVLRLIVIEKNYESDFFRIADAMLYRGGVFFDVGANHGLFSVGLVGRWSDSVGFHLFEPNPKLRKTLERSFGRFPNATVFINGFAVASSPGVVRMAFNDSHSGESYVTEQGDVEVACRTLDDYIAENRVERISLMKIDVEGFELSALRGLGKSLGCQVVDAIYFEYCEEWLRRHHPARDLIDLLKGSGYSIFYCRADDIVNAPPKSSFEFRLDMAAPGVVIRPIEEEPLPAATDLLAISQKALSSGILSKLAGLE